MGALFFTLVLIGLAQATGTVQFHGDTWRPQAADAALPPDPFPAEPPAVVPTAPPLRPALPSTF